MSERNRRACGGAAAAAATGPSGNRRCMDGGSAARAGHVVSRLGSRGGRVQGVQHASLLLFCTVECIHRCRHLTDRRAPSLHRHVGAVFESEACLQRPAHLACWAELAAPFVTDILARSGVAGASAAGRGRLRACAVTLRAMWAGRPGGTSIWRRPDRDCRWRAARLGLPGGTLSGLVHALSFLFDA